jgi:ABC-type antimicrobial peptide transport system permease subunit
MKALSIIGFVIAVLALGAGLYLHFVVAPLADMHETIRFNDYNDVRINQNSMAYINLKVDLGILVMFTGLLSLLLCIYPAIKKNKLAWIGVLFSLISAVIGAAYGTHMFS